MQIQDLVSIDEQAKFRNDVQISNFTNTPLNLGLLRSYLFSKSTFQGEVRSISPVGVLDKLIDVFLHEGIDNRMAVIADYGHGKSHLALALANYFSKPLESEEIQVLLSKLSNVDNGGNDARYRGFKESKGEFFVIRLRGDEPKSLTQQFYTELKVVLNEHQLTEDVIPPLWSVPVSEYLSRLSEEQRNQANHFLHQFNRDLPLLLQQVNDHLDEAYDISIKLVERLTGVVPDFNARVGIANVLDWLVHNYCGIEGHFGGVLVIVDEFSLYIQKYANRNAAGELMDLLNGVERNRGKCAFVAFGQHDPTTTARNFTTGVLLQNLEHELTRIPQTKRYILYSLLESVIDAYLFQNEHNWQTMFTDEQTAEKFQDANDMAIDVFRARYIQSLRWHYEDFEANVSKGCFPLHPITTTLLCSLEFQASTPGVGAPRNVLGFVLDEYDRKKFEPSVINTTLNWILPIYLVDYFKEMLPSEGYGLYLKALKIAGNDDCPPEENAVLKALLLQEISKVNPSGQQQEKFLAQCSGLDVTETQRILQDLVRRNCIKYEAINHRYGFWAAGIDPLRLETILKRYENQIVIGQKSIDDLNKEFFTRDISISVDWGNSLDWVPCQKVFLPGCFTAGHVNEIIKPSSRNPISDLIEKPKGYIFWLLPKDENETQNMKSLATQVLAEVVDENYPIPILVVLPQRPCFELHDWIKRKLALEMFSQDERIQVGSEIYTHESDSLTTNIKEQITQFLEGESTVYSSISRNLNCFITPTFSQASILNEFGHRGEASIEDVLGKMYRLSYNRSPNYFITHLRVNNSQLQNAVKIILGYILKNNLSIDEPSIQSNAVARDICNKALVQNWKILTNQWNVKEPANPRIKEAWNFIDENFVTDNPAIPKMVKLETIIKKLLSPPFGYDTNTLSLLLSAWMGYNAAYLKVFITGQQAGLRLIGDEISNGPKKFIQNLADKNYALQKVDRGEIARQINQIINKVHQQQKFKKEEVNVALNELREFIDLNQGNPADITNAKEARDVLIDARTVSERYDRDAKTIKEKINNVSDLSELISLQRSITALNGDSIVERAEDSPADLRNLLDMRLSLRIESLCITNEKLQNIQSYSLNKEKLINLKSSLETNGFNRYIDRVNRGLTNLDSKLNQLREAEKEGPIIVQIKQMDLSANLAKLREYNSTLNNFQRLSDSTRLLKESKQKTIQQRIQDYHNVSEQLIDAAKILDSQYAVEEWTTKYLRIIEKYSNTEIQGRLDQSYAKVQTIRSFIEELSNVVMKDLITSPTKAEHAQTELDKIREKYLPILGQNQTALVEKKEEQLAEIIRNKTKEALDWLNETQEAFSNGTIPYSELIMRVTQVPEFLPNSELALVERIKVQLQNEMEKDSIIIIETEFNKISSKEKREECIKRLQKLL